MKFGAVVVTYNRPALLKECIGHLLSQSEKIAYICVVDNHSDDDTKTYLDGLVKESHDSTEITVWHLPENLGGAGGFAFGMEHMPECDWVLILDDDAMIAPDYLERIHAQMNAGHYLAYSGTVKTENSIDLLHRRRIKSRWRMQYVPVSENEYKRETFIYDISTFCGLVLDYRVMRKLGLPRADYFIWFDDTEYCLRLGEYSRILNVNGAVLDHRTGIFTGKTSIGWKNYYGLRNAADIGKKYAKNGFLYLAGTYVNYTIHICLAAFLGVLCPAERKKYRQIRQIYTDAMRDSMYGRMGKNEKYLPKGQTGGK